MIAWICYHQGNQAKSKDSDYIGDLVVNHTAEDFMTFAGMASDNVPLNT